MGLENRDIPQLTRTASRIIRWDSLTDAIRLSLTEIGAVRGEAAPEHERISDSEVIRRTFVVFKDEFGRAAGTMQRAITISIVMLLIALSLAIAGGVLLFSKPWAGGTMSAAAMGTLFGLVQRVRLLAKDEVLLRVIPAKYEAALQLAASRMQYEKILNDMLNELNTIRA